MISSHTSIKLSISHPLHWIRPYVFHHPSSHHQHNVPWPHESHPPLQFSCNCPYHWQGCNWTDMGFTHCYHLHMAIIFNSQAIHRRWHAITIQMWAKYERFYESTMYRLTVLLMLPLISFNSFAFNKEFLALAFICFVLSQHIQWSKEQLNWSV